MTQTVQSVLQNPTAATCIRTQLQVHVHVHVCAGHNQSPSRYDYTVLLCVSFHMPFQIILAFEFKRAHFALKRLDVTDVMNGAHVHFQIVLECKLLVADLTFKLSAQPVRTIVRHVVVRVDR